MFYSKIGITKVFLIPLLVLNPSFILGQNAQRNNNLQLLSNGLNLAYRAGVDRQNNELLAGYYLDFVNKKNHKLLTFDADIWSNFNRIGFNSTISYSGDLLGIAYSTDVFKSLNQVRIVPALGLNFGYNDLFSAGIYYNYKFNKEIDYPTFSLKIMLRPAFLRILSKNPDGAAW